MLVSGGDGQLGQDMLAVAAERGLPAVGLGRADLDVTDRGSVASVMEAIQPSAIIHCAAWTDVDGAEADEDAALAVNRDGARNLTEAARAFSVPMASISTDYVFDGSNSGGYVETDEPAPINAYGRTKLAGELAALEHDRGLVIRTAWVFGEHGQNFPATILRLARDRDAIDVVTDQVGSPTWTRHLAAATLDALEAGMTGIVHMAGGPPASWFEVAQEVVEAAGLGCEVRPTSSDAFPRPAARPACSILRSERDGGGDVGDWRAGVRAVVAAWSTAGTMA